MSKMDAITHPDHKSRRISLINTITNTKSSERKDSVVPIWVTNTENESRSYSPRSSTGSTDSEQRTRRMSRKLSLKPPTSVQRERRESQSSRKYSDGVLLDAPSSGYHNLVCECGKEIKFRCRFLSPSLGRSPSITLSGAEVNELKQAITSKTDTKAASPLCPRSNVLEQHGHIKLQEIIDDIKNNIDDYDLILQRCIDIGKVEDQDSLDVVLSRQNTIKCLLLVLTKYPSDLILQHEACQSLLKQVQHSEVSLHYLCMNDGIELLDSTVRSQSENQPLLATILEIFSYFSAQDEWRIQLTEKINQSYFLTTMARFENDALIVEKCCIIIGNLVLSDDLARSLMYVGGVHSVISMLNKYESHLGVLRHCCVALGTFASHDDTCQAVAEAGATQAIMAVFKSHPLNAEIIESCCWAMASLSRSDGACVDMIHSNTVRQLLDVMQTFVGVPNIQEYGCWALCNLVAFGSELNDDDGKAAMEVLSGCMGMFPHNVELQEHVCYATNSLVSQKPCVHEIFMRSDGINHMIELMKDFEDSDDIQINSAKVIGNLAVHGEFRYYLEDVGSSEALISCMLKLEKNQSIQLTGCMALTNLAADLADNKYRILKNGGVNAVLQAMKNFMEDESIQLNALKLLCNLIESDKGCWWIAEESGIQVISMTLNKYFRNPEILQFGCTCLGNLPRRGINSIALESVESTLLYLRQRESGSVEIARGVCTFYENILKTDSESKKLFKKLSMDTVISILQEFEDTEILITGCRCITLVALGDQFDMMTKNVTSIILAIMRRHQADSNIQLICCGTISYLSGSDDGIESLSELDCIEAILDALKMHPDEQNLHNVGLIALENVCKADLVRGLTIQNVCDVVSLSMKSHPFDEEVQDSGSEILSIIGDGFHKQNVLRRQSMDCLEPVVGAFKRRSVTEEILEIASSALQRVIKFKDDVLEDSEGSTGTDQSAELSTLVSDASEN